MVVLTVLRKGQHDLRVRELQTALKNKGYAVNTDGSFGVHTELAVIAFQRKSGLLPDGIAGPRTLQLLGLYTDPMGRPPSNPAELSTRLGHNVVAGGVQAPPSAPSRPATAYSTSQEGLRFLYVHEAQRGVSNHLHWPGGSSGVTLGPGYDMGGRSAAEIANDLTSIGVGADSAKVVGDGAAGLTGPKAKDFAQANKKMVNMTEDQEMQLLRKVVPKYEHHVQHHIHVDIFQYQFDALVSFDYNCGGRLKVFKDINDGEVAAAVDEMKKVNTSGGKVMSGLVLRREHEITLYLYGKYAKSAASQ